MWFVLLCVLYGVLCALPCKGGHIEVVGVDSATGGCKDHPEVVTDCAQNSVVYHLGTICGLVEFETARARCSGNAWGCVNVGGVAPACNNCAQAALEVCAIGSVVIPHARNDDGRRLSHTLRLGDAHKEFLTCRLRNAFLEA